MVMKGWGGEVWHGKRVLGQEAGAALPYCTPLLSPQAAGPAAATLLWSAWGGVRGHGSPPLPLLLGVLSCQ